MLKQLSLPLPAHINPGPDAHIPRISVRAGLLRYRSDRYALLTELGANRSDIVESRLGSLRLHIITEAGLARSILAEHADSFKKGPAMARHVRPFLGDGLLTATGTEHRRQRKVLAPKFTPKHIGAFATTMAQLTQDMLRRWRAGVDTADFGDEITSLTMSIAARTMFGTDISDADIAALAHGLDVANRWVIEQATSPGSLPLWTPTARNRRMRAALRAMDAIVYRLIAEHRASNQAGDVLSTLLSARDENGQSMDDKLVRDQVMTFFMAGHETVATALSWSFQLLARHPFVAEKLADEADAVLGPGSEADDEAYDLGSFKRLSYARQVFLEAMRLYPPIYMIGRQATRDVIARGSDEYRIPAGTYVIVNTLGLHRRPDYFPEPLAFRPERHAGTSTWPRAAFQPFGAGPRVCIGNHFGMMEGTIILALLARSIRFNSVRQELAPDPLITLRPSGGIPFSVQWRR